MTTWAFWPMLSAILIPVSSKLGMFSNFKVKTATRSQVAVTLCHDEFPVVIVHTNLNLLVPHNLGRKKTEISTIIKGTPHEVICCYSQAPCYLTVV